ncbi:MAG: IS630 family transposase [Magnetococcales bacterium]|nr:IS630 family transposase [Magnetococcales bacterium]
MEKHVVRLTEEERKKLSDLTSKGRGSAAALRRARILLKADEGGEGPGWTDPAICDALEVSLSTVARVRKAFVEEGFDAALDRKKPQGRQYQKLDGAQEAHLIAVACSTPPEGRTRWTLKMLSNKLIELNIVDYICPECVRVTFKKNELKPWLREQWVIPPNVNADFVCAMEDVLGVYMRPYDPKRPVVCFDEMSKQLVKETREPIPAETGRKERFDYEYERNGTANIFINSEPLAGRRSLKVTDRRTAIDFAEVIREIVDDQYPDAEKVVLVMDNLNTHKPASLYQAFEPKEARRLLDRLEIHYTPKHGSWLNMAEIELSVLSGQCLDRRIPDQETLVREIAAWEKERNQGKCKVKWQFTTDTARIKLARLYPSIQLG